MLITLLVSKFETSNEVSLEQPLNIFAILVTWLVLKLDTFNEVNGDLVKYEIAERRPGDIDECYASSKRAEEELGFKATKTLADMCKSSYEYQKNNKKK